MRTLTLWCFQDLWAALLVLLSFCLYLCARYREGPKEKEPRRESRPFLLPYTKIAEPPHGLGPFTIQVPFVPFRLMLRADGYDSWYCAGKNWTGKAGLIALKSGQILSLDVRLHKKQERFVDKSASRVVRTGAQGNEDPLADSVGCEVVTGYGARIQSKASSELRKTRISLAPASWRHNSNIFANPYATSPFTMIARRERSENASL